MKTSNGNLSVPCNTCPSLWSEARRSQCLEQLTITISVTSICSGWILAMVVGAVIRHHTQYRELPQTMKTALNRQNNWVLMLDDAEFTTVLSQRKRKEGDLHDSSSFWLGGPLRMEASGKRTHTEHSSLNELSRYVRIQEDWGKYRAPQKETPREICAGPPHLQSLVEHQATCVHSKTLPLPRPRPNIK